MQRQTLYLIRGLTGSGKSTLVTMLEWSYFEENVFTVNVTADDYFIDRPTGEYRFDPKLLKNAHEHCQDLVRRYFMKSDETNLGAIMVHNTFSCNWEMKPYKDMAKEYGWSVFVIECQNDFGTTHDVPDEVRDRMSERWERNKDDQPTANG